MGRRGELKIKNRILKYNEDDCITTRVLLDGICSLRAARQDCAFNTPCATAVTLFI